MSSHAINEATTYETLIHETSSETASYHDVNPTQLERNVPSAIQERNVPPVETQWIITAVVQQNKDLLHQFYTTFLKGKPKALGIVLIVTAILEIAMGIGLAFSSYYFLSEIVGIQFWGPVFYIIAGSLTIAAQAKPNICLVRGSLSLNIISIIISFIAMILPGINIARDYNMNDYNCNSCLYNNYSYYNYYCTCYGYFDAGTILNFLLLVINLLLFCVSFSVSIFGCCSLSHVPTNSTQVFMMQKNDMVTTNPSTVPATSLFPPTPAIQYFKTI